jgi:hypothetical protein
MSSRRTESRNLTGNGKVGSSCTSPRAVRRPVDHDTWVQERGTREKEVTVNEQERDTEARTSCGKESLSLLGKAASHRQRSYGEEGADDRRSASKGEKEGTKVSHRLLLYVEDELRTAVFFSNKAL